jgi:hypothetical protein
VDAPPAARLIAVRDVAVVVPVLVERAKVDINLAGADELAALLNRARARRILAFNTARNTVRFARSTT